MGAIIMAVFAATRVAGEYRHDTIAQRVLAAPRRARLVVASLVVHGTFAAVVTGAAFLVGAALAGPMLAGKNLTTGLSGGELLHVGAAVVLAGSSFGLLGVSVGFLTEAPRPPSRRCSVSSSPSSCSAAGSATWAAISRSRS